MSNSTKDTPPTDNNNLKPLLQDQEIHSTSESESNLSRVVCICLDTTSGKDAFEWAVDNFIQVKTDLVILLHVRQIDLPIAPYINATGYLDEVGEEIREESHQLLRHYASKLVKKQIACKAISMIGDPKSEIVRKVKEVKADAVVVGSRNFGIVKRTLLGSVSDHLAHHLNECTVIIARPKGKGSS
ncbi:unnamed protein product [Cunninghamella blakesleeana]